MFKEPQSIPSSDAVGGRPVTKRCSSVRGFFQKIPESLQQICSSGVKGRELIALPRGYEPSPHDIICGRGRGNYNSPGNLLFRETTGQFVQEYLQANTKSQKTLVLEKVVTHVKTQNNKCRFIKKQGNAWFEIGDILAREKAGHVMREWCTSKSAKAGSSKLSSPWDSEDSTDQMMSSTQSLPSMRHMSGDPEEHFAMPARPTTSLPVFFTSSRVSSSSLPVSVGAPDSSRSLASGLNSKPSEGATEEPEESMEFFIPPVEPSSAAALSSQQQLRTSLVSDKSVTSHDSILDEMSDQVKDDMFVVQFYSDLSKLAAANHRGSFTLDNGDLSRSSLNSLSMSTMRGSASSGMMRGSASSGMMRGSASSGMMRGSASSGMMRGSASSGMMRGSTSSGMMRGSASSGMMRGSASSGMMRGSVNSNCMVASMDASFASDFSRLCNSQRTSFVSHRGSLRSSTNSNISSDQVFGRRVAFVSSSWQKRRVSIDDSILAAMIDEDDDYYEYDDSSTTLCATESKMCDSFTAPYAMSVTPATPYEKTTENNVM